MRPRVERSRAALAGFLALLLNSAYLAAFAASSVFYFINVAAHPLLGIGLALMLARLFSVRQFRVSSSLLAGGLFGLALGLILGLAVLVVGATRPYRTLLQAHILVSSVGSALVLVHLWRASRGPADRLRQGYGESRRSALRAKAEAGLHDEAAQAGRRDRLLVRLAVVVVILATGAALVTRLRHDDARRLAYRIENPTVVPASMDQEGRGPASPFFPSSADTNVRGIIPANFFLTSESCERCHHDIYEQWHSSAHHFSSFNNQWYRKAVEYMQEVVGTRPSKWCAGCHDHAVFFNGRFERPIKEQIETPEAQAGLACTSCHSITHVKSTMGQGDFEIEYPALHDLAVSRNPVLRAAHDTLLELDPQPHRETFLKPFHHEQTPEFCSICHKVHLDVPVNAYRWFRGFNDYDNWQASGVSGEGARSFYYPPKSQRCADCHMPLVDSNDPAAKNGKVRSHRFPAANTALPFVNGDAAQLEAVRHFLRDGQVTVDIFGIVRAGAPAGAEIGSREGAETRIASAFAVGEESMAFGAPRALIATPAEVVGPLGTVPVPVHRGESVRLEVVVRTRKVGHFFPAGTVDAFDVWVELEAVDDRGREILHSGALEFQSGPVDPGAHFYRSLLLDQHGNRINKRNAWAARSVAYVRLIPPGAADTIHYRLEIPPDAGDRILLTAKVNYRKFAWWNTQWAFAGIRDPDQPRFPLAPGYDDGRWVFAGDTSRVSGPLRAIPDLPITVMAEHKASLVVLPRDATPLATRPPRDPSVRERWNDYGIGLLLQGDLKAAESVFLDVTRMEPGYADGWVNVGRARIQEGNMSGAEQVLRKALEIDPALARTHFFLATALKALGQYDEAIAHLQQASSRYPRDRVVLNQLGRVLFLKRRYGDAIVLFKRVLAIDPEDLQAHYNLMLCSQGLGDSAGAEKERQLYARFKADESSQAITGDYRRLNPEDNNERQPVHEHRALRAEATRTGAR